MEMKDKVSSLIFREEEGIDEQETATISRMSNSVDRHKRTKCQSRRKPRLKTKFAIIAEAAKIVRELKKTKRLFHTLLRDSTTVIRYSTVEKEKKEEVEGEKESGLNRVLVTDEDNEEKDQIFVLKNEEKEELTSNRGIGEEKHKEEEEKGAIEKIELKILISEEKSQGTGDVKTERLNANIEGTIETEIKESEKERTDYEKRFINKNRVSQAMQLRATEITESIFPTSALVRPSFRPIFQPLPTCVRLDHQLSEGSTSLRRLPETNAMKTRNAAFSRLTHTVLRGQNLAIDAKPEAFYEEVTIALRDFISAHQLLAKTPVVAATPPAKSKFAHQTFPDDIDIEPRGDGSFVARKKRFQSPPKTPRGAIPLYGRCRI